jgi:dTDP-D-glucose 4,6-dehydratase
LYHISIHELPEGNQPYAFQKKSNYCPNSQYQIRETSSDHIEALMTILTQGNVGKTYAIDATKLAITLNWIQKYSFSDGLHQTVQWHLVHS